MGGQPGASLEQIMGAAAGGAPATAAAALGKGHESLASRAAQTEAEPNQSVLGLMGNCHLARWANTEPDAPKPYQVP